MLSIAKINSTSNQAKTASGSGSYLFYLSSPSTRQRTDFLDYLNASEPQQAPAAFWAGRGPKEFNLPSDVLQEHVERLSLGFSPVDEQSLVLGAGPHHVKGVDMTFSAPKDVSAIFAGADPATQDAINLAMQNAVKSALSYSESISVTRHGKGGRIKNHTEAIIAACYPHFASRAIQPQLHIHAFLFNLGLRPNGQWSALDHKAQFDHKMTTGMLFRVELAYQLAQQGFEIIPDRQYFKINGISEHQRTTLSKRRSEIQDYMRTHDGASSKEAEVAALNTRSAKAEPHYLDLIHHFKNMVAELGITPDYVESIRMKDRRPQHETFTLSHQEVLDELMHKRSTVTVQDALHLIALKSMGRWTSAQCREYLQEFLSYADVLHLGNTEHLTQIITSKQRYEQEANIALRIQQGLNERKFQIESHKVDQAFQRLQKDLSTALGMSVQLDEQRAAAQYVCTDSDSHAFVVGSAGAGKTTLLKAIADIYRSDGYEVLGCAQSTSASLNLSKEAGIRSSTIAGLLLRHAKGTLRFSDQTILILDEAGVVGSREFNLLQEAIVLAGGKLVAVGDYKQHAPIEAGGIFRTLVEQFGAAEISKIQRQRTNFHPLYQALGESSRCRKLVFSKIRLAALKALSEEERIRAVDALAQKSPILASIVRPWQAQYDFRWMRSVVEKLSKGQALEALTRLSQKGHLHIQSTPQRAMTDLIEAWKKDQNPLQEKMIIAGLRAEVYELNQMARRHLIEIGTVNAHETQTVTIKNRDESLDQREFAPGDRMVFIKNDQALGLVNGATGTLIEIKHHDRLIVRLDEPNARNVLTVAVPISFAYFDHAYSLTTYKSQGRTFDSAYVYLNPTIANREWTYVASSRTRYATSLYVAEESLKAADLEDMPHQEETKVVEPPIQILARRISRSQAKTTTLDYETENLRFVSMNDLKVANDNIIKHSQGIQDHWKEATRQLIQRIKNRAFGYEQSR